MGTATMAKMIPLNSALTNYRWPPGRMTATKEARPPSTQHQHSLLTFLGWYLNYVAQFAINRYWYVYFREPAVHTLAYSFLSKYQILFWDVTNWSLYIFVDNRSEIDFALTFYSSKGTCSKYNIRGSSKKCVCLLRKRRQL